MTYCLTIKVNQGLVSVSDSRTNAGIDNVSTYSKMRTFGKPGERQFVICASGNLATTQSVFHQIEGDLNRPEAENLFTVDTVADAASYIGKTSVERQKLTPGGHVFEASFLVSGEIAGAPSQAFLVYPEGNYIAAGNQTPFLQIGELKYGKPILDRLINVDTALDDATCCALLSMDATTRSNLSVGPPIEVNMYSAGSLTPGKRISFGEDSRYLRELRQSWNQALRTALGQMPRVDWDAFDD